MDLVDRDGAVLERRAGETRFVALDIVEPTVAGEMGFSVPYVDASRSIVAFCTVDDRGTTCGAEVRR